MSWTVHLQPEFIDLVSPGDQFQARLQVSAPENLSSATTYFQIFSNILTAYRPPIHIFKYSQISWKLIVQQDIFSDADLSVKRLHSRERQLSSSRSTCTSRSKIVKVFKETWFTKKKLLLTSNLVCSFDKSCCLNPCRESLGSGRETLRSRSISDPLIGGQKGALHKYGSCMHIPNWRLCTTWNFSDLPEQGVRWRGGPPHPSPPGIAITWAEKIFALYQKGWTHDL